MFIYDRRSLIGNENYNKESDKGSNHSRRCCSSSSVDSLFCASTWFHCFVSASLRQTIKSGLTNFCWTCMYTVVHNCNSSEKLEKRILKRELLNSAREFLLAILCVCYFLKFKYESIVINVYSSLFNDVWSTCF